LDTQQGEEIPGHRDASEPLGLAASRQFFVACLVERVPACQIGKRPVVLSKIHVMFGLGGSPVVDVRNRYQPPWVAEWQRTKQESVHDTEYCGTGADAEARDQNRKRCEPRIAPHPTKRVAQIVHQIVHPADNPNGTSFF
jgi:hypothetical protein